MYRYLEKKKNKKIAKFISSDKYLGHSDLIYIYIYIYTSTCTFLTYMYLCKCSTHDGTCYRMTTILLCRLQFQNCLNFMHKMLIEGISFCSFFFLVLLCKKTITPHPPKIPLSVEAICANCHLLWWLFFYLLLL